MTALFSKPEIPPAPAPPPPPTAVPAPGLQETPEQKATEERLKRAREEQRTARGRASTILTGPQGLGTTDPGSLSRRVLLGA